MATRIMALRITERERVRAYMVEEAWEFTDPITGEVNATHLAEDAANFFDLYGPAPTYDIPEWVFEDAAEISDLGGNDD